MSAIKEENCYLFENGREERITAAGQPASEQYIKRCPFKKKDDLMGVVGGTCWQGEEAHDGNTIQVHLHQSVDRII